MSLNQGLCDFCSAHEQYAAYPAENFETYTEASGMHLTNESVGAWTACRKCFEDIEAQNREGLVNRSLANLLTAHPDMLSSLPELRKQLIAIHAGFFEHRSDPGHIL